MELIGVDERNKGLVDSWRGHILQDQTSKEPLGSLLPSGVIEYGERAPRGGNIRVEANLNIAPVICQQECPQVGGRVEEVGR